MNELEDADSQLQRVTRDLISAVLKRCLECDQPLAPGERKVHAGACLRRRRAAQQRIRRRRRR